ncbi:unnamed protein product [Zymoseptoria tritici ST99CH_3D1]|uniref:Uncharacterized protein n=2 Tax=Zymoseptoria tritici TaxID=1047171 RepID=A0A1X7RTU5_ZYMT9|nr:unnamed protein product [Zymoseptoria tritici ST99CH_3D7]SMR52569.1 unnamed protein product [Zymoseptoria tritici ST99CH_1E4]SMR53765.1 unnamed protein product [Zymoseptoria tritici ST99CH_3D1]
MAALESASLIVARYLKANHYNESYEAFVREAGLPRDAGTTSKGDLTLETLLEEKRVFDVSVRFEKLGVDDGKGKWSLPAPSVSKPVTDLPTASNILSVRVEVVDDGESLLPVLLATTADRRLHMLDARTLALRKSFSAIHDSPVLSCTAFGKNRLLTSSMSGQVHLSDLEGKTLQKRKDHTKYVVRVAILPDASSPIIATAGWDSKVFIYRPKPASNSELDIGEPAATIELPTKPESMVFVRHPDTNHTVLLVTRTDSTFIYYYTVTEDSPRLLGRQNLAPHSNAWVAFTPSSMDLCPTDPTLLAIGTSSTPHMKLLIVRLLFPPWDASSEGSSVDISTPTPSLRRSLLDDTLVTETQASQARAALLVADREDAAIVIQTSTLAPQTPYSTPAVAWRPDGTGVWVNGDDGAVRGIEAVTGKVISVLQGHEAGSKVRCLWAGNVESEHGMSKEVVVSGGFDHRLIVWEIE